MRGESLTGGGEAPQVDDAPHARRGCGSGEGSGGTPVGLLETAAGAESVDQVVGHLDPVERPPRSLRIGRVGPDPFHSRGPRVVPQPFRRPAHAANPETGVEKLRNEPAADVTGGAGDQAGRPALKIGHGASLPTPTSLLPGEAVRGLVRTAGGYPVARPPIQGDTDGSEYDHTLDARPRTRRLVWWHRRQRRRPEPCCGTGRYLRQDGRGGQCRVGPVDAGQRRGHWH